jgi:hypothetical protein
MSSYGKTWEGYQWVDGWPVTPPRHWTQQPTAPNPPDEPEEEREMVVEPDSAANTVADTVTNTADCASMHQIL